MFAAVRCHRGYDGALDGILSLFVFEGLLCLRSPIAIGWAGVILV